MSGYKGLLLASSACGILCAVAILWQAFTAGPGILNAVFLEKAVLDGLWPQLGQLLFWVTLRFVLQALEEYFAFRLGQGIQFDLRQAFLQKIDAYRTGGFATGAEGPIALYDKRGHRYIGKLFQQVFTTAFANSSNSCVVFMFLFFRGI